MAMTTSDIKSSEDVNATKIQAARGTLNPTRDPAPDAGLNRVRVGVEAQLVEESGYVRVRNNGTQEIVFMHKYWYPGETRIMHPGDLENLMETYDGNTKVRFKELDAPEPLGDLVEEYEQEVQKVMGKYHTGEKQIAAIALNLVPPATEAEQREVRDAAKQKDKALENQALRDTKEEQNRLAAERVVAAREAQANAATVDAQAKGQMKTPEVLKPKATEVHEVKK